MIEMSLPQSEPVMLPVRSFGQQARSVAGYSLLTALMIVTPMLPVFVPAALFHCGLRNGRRAAWVTAVLALLPAFVLAAFTGGGAEVANLAWSQVAAIALAVMFPSLAALPLVERRETFGRVLTFLLAGSAIGLVATELAARAALAFSPYAAEAALLRLSNTSTLQFYRDNGIPPEALRMMERWTSYSTVLMPGFMLILLTFVFVLSLLMLGRLQAWRDVANRQTAAAPSPYLFRNFALPDVVLFAFVLGGLTPLASGLLQKVAANTLAVVAFLFILQGLAIYRYLLVAMGAGFAGTMLGWTLLVFLTLTGVGPLLLGVVGLFDPFFDFRHFKKRKDDSHESHSD